MAKKTSNIIKTDATSPNAIITDADYRTWIRDIASRDLRAELGVNEGFSESTLRYAARFYELYAPLFPNRQQVADGLTYQILQQPAEELQKSQNELVTNLQQLADRIVQVDETLRQQAAHAVNCMLTARNWFIGFYIVEFEQQGVDRAQYGEQLLKTLAKRINRKGMDWRSLYDFRTFYNVYPQLQGEILRYLQSQMQRPTDIPVKKLQSLSAIFQSTENQPLPILQSAIAKSPEPWQTAPDRLFHRISYTSLRMLSQISDPLKRAFYEFELIQGCWTTRELDHQISSLYYESFDRLRINSYQNGMHIYPQAC